MTSKLDAEPVHDRPEEDGKPSVRFWISQLAAAEKAAEPSRHATARAWREYMQELSKDKGKHSRSDDCAVKARYPIYWASTKTIQPAIYSRTPAPTVDKVFDDLADEQARVAAICLERLAKYLMRCTPFDRVQYATRDEFIHGGKTTNRVCFGSDIRSEPVCVRYTEQMVPDPSGQPQMVTDPMTGQQIPGPPMMVPQYLDSMGEPPPEGAELQQDEHGYYADVMNDEVGRVSVELVPVHYADILHTPSARHHEEIDWIAYRSLMTRGDVEDRFGKKTADLLVGYYKAADTGDDLSDREKDVLPSLYATIWEIWDKRRREVYWYCVGFNDAFIDRQEDIYGLEGFFPSPPFMLGTVGPDSLYVTPDYIQLEPLILQMHGAFDRFRKLVRSTRRRGIYDKNVEGLKLLSSDTDEGEFIGVGDFQRLINDKGGLQSIVQFFPVGELTQAIQEIANVMQLWQETFNEIYGIPDILRGTSDPNETAAAQQLKGQYNSLRFSAIQREFQRLCRDSLELMCDLALKKFPDNKLAAIMGVALMPPDEQAAFPQVLELLRDDTERKVRIDIETDSTITMNENADIEQRNYMAKTVFDGLAAVASAKQQNPAFAAAAAQMLVYVTQGLRKGKEVEKALGQIAETLTQQAMQPEQPPPDPAMMKAQAAVQATQAKTQAQIQTAQMKAQTDIAVAQAKTQADIQRSNVESQNAMAVEQGQLQHDATVQQLRMQLEAMQAKFEQELELVKAAMKVKSDVREQQAKASSQVQAAQIKAASQAFTTPPPGGDTINVHLGRTDVK